MARSLFLFPFYFLVSLILYSGSLHNNFAMDDYSLLVEDTSMHDLSLMPQNIFHPSTAPNQIAHYRPVYIISRMLLYHFFGTNPFYYHLTNIILFSIYVFLLFVVFQQITKSNSVALLASLLACFHPVNSAIVNFIAAHHIILGAILSELTLIFFLKFSLDRKKALFQWLGVGCLLFSILTHEIALAVPLVLFAIGCFVLRQSWKEALSLCLPYILVDAVFVGLRFIVPSESMNIFYGNLVNNPIKFSNYLVSVFQLWGWYIAKLLYPKDVVFIWNVLSGGRELVFLGLVGFLFLAGAVTFVSLRKRGPVPFIFAWALIGFLPLTVLCFVYYSLMGMCIEIHWVFFSSAWFFLLVALGLEYVKDKVSKYALVIILFFTFYSWGQQVKLNNALWKGTETYANYLIRVAPHNPYALRVLAKQYLREGKTQQAIYCFEQTLAFGAHYSIYEDLAFAYEKRGELDKAKQFMQKAISLYPGSPYLHNNLGIILFEENKFLEARKEYLKATGIKKDFFPALRNLADVEIQLNELDAASRVLTDCLALRASPEELKVIYAKLAIIYHKQKRVKEFLAVFEKYLLLNPTQDDLLSFSRFCVDLGAADLAAKVLDVALEKYPGSVEALALYGMILANRGYYREALDKWEKAVAIDPQNTQQVRGNINKLKILMAN